MAADCKRKLTSPQLKSVMNVQAMYPSGVWSSGRCVSSCDTVPAGDVK